MKEEYLMTCPRHGLTSFIKDSRGSFRCKCCRVDAITKKRRNNKIALVDYKGGKCEMCGYDKCIDALEFHHLIPENKEFGLANGDIKSLERLKKESDKCILLCANCHRELHAKEHEENRLKNEVIEKINMDNFNIVEESKIRKISHQNALKSIDKEEVVKDINNGMVQLKIAEKHKVSISTIKRFLQINNLSRKK